VERSKKNNKCLSERIGEEIQGKKYCYICSYARGEQTSQSDIDIIVEFKEPAGMLFIHLADFLEEIL